MKEQEASQNTEHTEHRGGLIYQQESGYKLITLIVWLRTPDEQSRVFSREDKFEFEEEAEHMQPGPPLVLLCSPLVAIDAYHFSVADEAEIELTIKGQSGEERKARYIVHTNGIEEDSPSFRLDLVRSSGSLEDQHIQTSQKHDMSSQLENPPIYPQEINDTLPNAHEISFDR